MIRAECLHINPSSKEDTSPLFAGGCAGWCRDNWTNKLSNLFATCAWQPFVDLSSKTCRSQTEQVTLKCLVYKLCETKTKFSSSRISISFNSINSHDWGCHLWMWGGMSPSLFKTISCQLHFYWLRLIFFLVKSLNLFLQLSSSNNQHEMRSESHSVFLLWPSVTSPFRWLTGCLLYYQSFEVCMQHESKICKLEPNQYWSFGAMSMLIFGADILLHTEYTHQRTFLQWSLKHMWQRCAYNRGQI